MTEIGNASLLAAYLTEHLELPPADDSQTVINPVVDLTCCIRDWRGDSVAVVNETSIVFTVNDSVHLTMRYSATGHLVTAEVLGPFGDILPDSDVQTLLRRANDTATYLGAPASRDMVAWNGTGSVLIEGITHIVPTTTVALFSNISGVPVAFGNELRVVFDVEHLRAIRLRVFPWFSAPSPALTLTEAYTIALDSLNATANPEGARLREGAVYYAFDFHRYSLVYQVEAEYVPESGVSSGSGDYRVWVDAYTGQIVYFIQIPPPPGPSTMSWNPAFLLIVIAAAALIVALAMLAIEPLWVGVLRFAGATIHASQPGKCAGAFCQGSDLRIHRFQSRSHLFRNP